MNEKGRFIEHANAEAGIKKRLIIEASERILDIFTFFLCA